MGAGASVMGVQITDASSVDISAFLKDVPASMLTFLCISLTKIKKPSFVNKPQMSLIYLLFADIKVTNLSAYFLGCTALISLLSYLNPLKKFSAAFLALYCCRMSMIPKK